jgi:hypothetical protein
MRAIETCLTGKGKGGSGKFPSVRDFNAELKMRLEDAVERGRNTEDSNVESVGAVVNADD